MYLERPARGVEPQLPQSRPSTGGLASTARGWMELLQPKSKYPGLLDGVFRLRAWARETPAAVLMHHGMERTASSPLDRPAMDVHGHDGMDWPCPAMELAPRGRAGATSLPTRCTCPSSINGSHPCRLSRYAHTRQRYCQSSPLTTTPHHRLTANASGTKPVDTSRLMPIYHLDPPRPLLHTAQIPTSAHGLSHLDVPYAPYRRGVYPGMDPSLPHPTSRLRGNNQAGSLDKPSHPSITCTSAVCSGQQSSQIHDDVISIVVHWIIVLH